MKRAANLQIPKVKNRYHPNNNKRQNDRRAEVEDSVKIFPKSHGGECDGRGKTNRGGNKSSHESERRMINPRKKMIFASRARQRGTKFSITKRTTKRCDSANDPKHEQRESGLNFRYLEAEAREDAGANDISNNNGGRRDKADRAPRS